MQTVYSNEPAMLIFENWNFHCVAISSVCSILTPRPCQYDHRRDTEARSGAGARAAAGAAGAGDGTKLGRMKSPG